MKSINQFSTTNAHNSQIFEALSKANAQMADNMSTQIQNLNQQMQSRCGAKNYRTVIISTSLPAWALVPWMPANCPSSPTRIEKRIGKRIAGKIDELYNGKVNIMGGLVMQNWTAEPYIRGSWAFPAPEKYRKQLGKPIGGNDHEKGESLVYFAGSITRSCIIL